jgi:hypothetical protein
MRIISSLLLLGWLAGCVNTGSSLDQPPVQKGSSEPSVIVTDNGLILSWMEAHEGDILLKMSVHNGIKWSPPKTIAKGQDWFVNWADFPAILANENSLFTYFLKKSESSTYAYDVMYLVSQDLGSSWSNPQKLHQDTVAAEHGFVSSIPYKDGFYVSWLDGRNTIDKAPMTIRAVYIDGEGNLNDAAEIDASTCDCCQTTMTLINNEPVTFYRDRTSDEIRDIYYASLIDSIWTQPQSLNADDWSIAGCPVNGPRATSYKNTTAVAWFTGANKVEKIKLKISSETGGFGDEIIVDSPNALGRVDIQMDSSKIYITYLTRLDNRTSIKLSIYDFYGQLLNSELIATVKPDRGTGFPRTALWNELLIITWTDIDEMKVKVLKYPLNKENFSSGARVDKIFKNLN